jgi:hypothetical protein
MEQSLIEKRNHNDVKVMNLGESILLALGEKTSPDDDAVVKRSNSAYSKAMNGYETQS